MHSGLLCIVRRQLQPQCATPEGEAFLIWSQVVGILSHSSAVRIAIPQEFMLHPSLGFRMAVCCIALDVVELRLRKKRNSTSYLMDIPAAQ